MEEDTELAVQEENLEEVPVQEKAELPVKEKAMEPARRRTGRALWAWAKELEEERPPGNSLGVALSRGQGEGAAGRA